MNERTAIYSTASVLLGVALGFTALNWRAIRVRGITQQTPQEPLTKVFQLGPLEHARKYFLPYSDTFLPVWSRWATGVVIPFIELIAGALVILGLRTREALISLGILTSSQVNEKVGKYDIIGLQRSKGSCARTPLRPLTIRSLSYAISPAQFL